jgi:hypothetical protein
VFRITAFVTLFAGVVFSTANWWTVALAPLIYDQAGEIRQDGAFRKISPMLPSVTWGLMGADIYGVPILLVGLTGISLSGARANFPERYKTRFSQASLTLGITANLLVILLSLQFFWTPIGASIRPMGWSVLLFFIALTTLILTSILSTIGLAKDKLVGRGIFGYALGITPYLVGVGVMSLAMYMRHFDLAD